MQAYDPTEVESRESDSQLPADREITVADTGGGLLVFAAKRDGDGRELVAFSDIDDWDAIRAALQKRGLDVGATYHLPVLDADEVPATFTEVDR